MAYTWGANGLVSQRLLASNRSLWYAFGPQGETRQLTDSTGNVADTYLYSPYGVALASTGSDANPFRYGGQAGYYADANNLTGTILCGLRWYAPALGRWLSRDPIGYEGGANLYEYCGSNPVMGIDPLGTWSFYRWFYTGDGNASDELYDTAINQGASTLNRWWGHFKDRNRKEWRMVVEMAVGGTMPYWPVNKIKPRSGARSLSSIARVACLPRGGREPGMLPLNWTKKGNWFNDYIRKPILKRNAMEVKADFVRYRKYAPIKGAIAGASVAEAILAWKAAFDTLKDPLDDD